MTLKRGKFLLAAKTEVSTPQINTITQKHLNSLLTLETLEKTKFSFKFHTPQFFLPLLTNLLCLLNNMVQPNGSFQRETQMRPTNASSTRTRIIRNGNFTAWPFKVAPTEHKVYSHSPDEVM